MAGLYTEGMEDLAPPWTGDERIPVDTHQVDGALPQAAAAILAHIADGYKGLVDAVSIVTNADNANFFKVTLAGNRTLANPTNLVGGRRYVWVLKQDATGSRTLAYGNKFKFPGGAPTLTTTANAIDVLIGHYDATDDIVYAVLTKAYAA